VQNASGLGLESRVAVRQLFFAENRIGILNQKARGVEHDHDFSQQGLDIRFPSFLSNAPRDVCFPGEKKLLEAAQDLHTVADAPGVPVRLRSARTSHCGADFGGPRTIQFAQHLAGRRINRGDPGDGELEVSGHRARTV